MKAKFEEFNDGMAGIFKENAEGKLERAFPNDFRFGEENVSIQRHYSAKMSDERVDKVIHIQKQKGIAAHAAAHPISPGITGTTTCRA